MPIIERAEELSWPGGDSSVWRLEGSFGVAVLKVLPHGRKFAQERLAYREWLPRLEGHLPEGVRVPRLLAARGGEPHALLLSSEPGRPALCVSTDAATESVIHERAGAFARVLHGIATPADPLPLADAYLARFEAVRQRAAGLVDVAVVRAVGVRVGELLPYLRSAQRVAIHNDFSPRNWLVTGAGEVTVIDFEHSRTDVFLAEFLPLWAGVWPERPDLRHAFSSGYGGELGNADRGALEQLGSLWALTTLTWARQHDDPELEELGVRALRRSLVASGPS